MGAGTVYTIASGKGGVGKTTVAVNLSGALALADREVVVIDTDFGMANLADHVGIAAETPTIHDVLAGRSDIDAAIRDVEDGLAVIPGAVDLDAFADIDPDGLVEIVEHVAERADVVVIDSGAGLSYETALPLGLADGVVLVTTPTTAAVQDTRKTADLSGRMGTPVDGLVVNRVTDESRMAPATIAERLDLAHLGTIAESAAVDESLVAGAPAVWHDPHSDASRSFRSMAQTITGVQIPQPVPTELSSPNDAEATDDDVSDDRGWLARLLGR